MADDRRNTMFTADALGLDFLNSGLTMDGAVDWLGSGEGLLTWLEQARLVPMEAAHTLRVSAFPGELDAVAAQARVLREWFRGFVLAHKGKPLPEGVLEKLKPLNRVLEGDEAFSTIAARVENEESAESPPLSALASATTLASASLSAVADRAGDGGSRLFCGFLLGEGV